jgi:hypothetical protein
LDKPSEQVQVLSDDAFSIRGLKIRERFFGHLRVIREPSLDPIDHHKLEVPLDEGTYEFL